MDALTDTDAELDRLWRERFGQPLPLRGCPDLAWRVLNREDRVVTKPQDGDVLH